MLRKYKVLLLNFDETFGAAIIDWLGSLDDIDVFSIETIDKTTPDIIIYFQSENSQMDIMLAEYISVPQIFLGYRQRALSAKLSNNHEAIFVKLPLRFVILEAKIRQVLRHKSDEQMKALKIGDYIFNPSKKALIGAKNSELKLTEKEISILTYLNQALGVSVGREELLREVWRYNEGVTTHTLETHIYRLRQKLSEIFANREIIITTEGGYRLEC